MREKAIVASCVGVGTMSSIFRGICMDLLVISQNSDTNLDI